MDNAARCRSCGAVLPAGSPCPHCGITTSPAPPPPTDARITSAGPEPSQALPLAEEVPVRAALSPAWAAAQGALTVLHAGLVVTFLGSLAIAVALAAALLRQASGPAGGDGSPVPDWAPLLQGLGALAILAGSVVYLVGQCMACAAPTEAGARGWAIGALVAGLVSRLLAGLALLLLVLAFLSGASAAAAGPDDLFEAERAARPAPVPRFLWLVALASGLAGLTEVVHVALFLRALAQVLGEKVLVRRAGEYARFFVTFTVGIGLLNYFAVPLLALIPGDLDVKMRLIPVALIGELICFLILFGQFIALVRDTRDAIARVRGPAKLTAGQSAHPRPRGE
jgi:hypothetical protein